MKKHKQAGHVICGMVIAWMEYHFKNSRIKYWYQDTQLNHTQVKQLVLTCIWEPNVLYGD